MERDEERGCGGERERRRERDQESSESEISA